MARSATLWVALVLLGAAAGRSRAQPASTEKLSSWLQGCLAPDASQCGRVLRTGVDFLFYSGVGLQVRSSRAAAAARELGTHARTQRAC